MKNKLQALLAEQKALTAKFEELLTELHLPEEEVELIDGEEWSCEKGLPIIARNETTNWRVEIFHSYDTVDVKYPFLCAINDDESRPYKHAIPYNDQTKHLIGSTDSPDRYYKFVEK